MDVRWIGLRVDAEPPFEALLIDDFAPWMRAKQNEGALRRWFFLWHGEDGYHLRLRLQLVHGTDSGALVGELKRIERAASGRFRLRPHDYDRSTRAFGETRESVLAELLHAATSELAVSVLTRTRTPVTAGRRWLLAAAAAAVLLRRAVPPEDLAEAVTSWLTFAERSARELGFDARAIGDQQVRARLGILDESIRRTDTAVDSHRAGLRAVALLRRARDRGERGRFVATHALHLFCNEMGLDFAQECVIPMSLRELWVSRPRAHVSPAATLLR